MASKLRNRKSQPARNGSSIPSGADFIRTSKSGLEWPRKLFHSATGFVVMALWTFYVPIRPVLYFLTTSLVVLITADIWRFNSKSFETFYEKRLGALMRQSEKNKINGVVYYLLGVISCLTFFPRDIAVVSIIILSWCDTAASIFGRLFGQYTPKLPFSGSLFAPRKSIAGSLAAVAAGSLVGYIFFHYLAPLGGQGDLSWEGAESVKEWTRIWTGMTVQRPTSLPQLPNPHSKASLTYLCIVSGLSAAFAEAVEIWGLDDNLTMAPLAGALIWFAMFVN